MATIVESLGIAHRRIKRRRRERAHPVDLTQALTLDSKVFSG
jgi:hypothetical protein